MNSSHNGEEFYYQLTYNKTSHDKNKETALGNVESCEQELL